MHDTDETWRMVCDHFNKNFADLPRLIEIAVKIGENKKAKDNSTRWWKRREEENKS